MGRLAALTRIRRLLQALYPGLRLMREKSQNFLLERTIPEGEPLKMREIDGTFPLFLFAHVF